MGSQYILSVEMLLDRFDQSNKFQRKVKRNFGSFEGPLANVLRTSWGRPESTSLGYPLKVRLGRPLDVISGLPQDVRSGGPRDVRLGRSRDGQMGPLGDDLRTLEEGCPRDVLGTNICRLG